jgi:hypothetical protein
MPITHTNRKGVTFYLCRGVTKTGKPRYYFAREPKGEPVEAIPEGHEIVESVNGVVSLAKIRPVLIRPEELALVRAALARRLKAYNYRVDVKGERIVIYERIGEDPDKMIQLFKAYGLFRGGDVDRFREDSDRSARFSPVLRFTLADETRRTFHTERWCYLGSIDDWVEISSSGPLHRWVEWTVPKLGTEAFFELMWPPA